MSRSHFSLMQSSLQANLATLSGADTNTLFQQLVEASPQLSTLLLIHANPTSSRGLSGAATWQAKVAGRSSTLETIEDLRSEEYVATQTALAARLKLSSSKVRLVRTCSEMPCRTTIAYCMHMPLSPG
jgi:hypothetical protein